MLKRLPLEEKPRESGGSSDLETPCPYFVADCRVKDGATL